MALPRLFCIVDGIECIVEDACFDHNGGREILNSIARGEVSAEVARYPC